MGLFNRKPKVLTPEQAEEIYTKDFFDMILPSTIKFFTDYYIVGDSYRSVWAVREYPPSTEEQAILSQLADRNGVTLRIYHRLVESMEQRKIIQNATRKNKLKSSGNDVNETIEAQGNLQDVVTLMANLRKNKEALLHCSVFVELRIISTAGKTTLFTTFLICVCAEFHVLSIADDTSPAAKTVTADIPIMNNITDIPAIHFNNLIFLEFIIFYLRFS